MTNTAKLMKSLLLSTVACGLITHASAQEAEPMAAIDWLSKSVEAPVVFPPIIGNGAAPSGAATPQVKVTPLDSPSPDGIGLLPLSVTGLPRSLWAKSVISDLVTLVQAERLETLPALHELMIVLMLAEGDPPLGAGPKGDFLLARADKLLDMGAIEQSQALIEAGNPNDPAAFRRWFDVALLTGTEADACRVMKERPDVAPTYPARIFCLARNGDWAAAALILNTGRALGDIEPEMDALMSRFLDPDLYEGEPPLAAPNRISPLVFRMREAVGEPLATAPLPRAFAHADLRDTAGWRNQMEAAERLVRDGALTPPILHSLYLARKPAASGGIWDRATAIQNFDAALSSGDTTKISSALPSAWDAARTANIEVAFASLYGERLAELTLNPDAQNLSLSIGLLSPSYEEIAVKHAASLSPLLAAIARGQVPDNLGNSVAEQAIVDGFSTNAPPIAFDTIMQQGRIGEALLRAFALFSAGLTGDPTNIGEALIVFRKLGLEDTARRAALQYLILDHPS